jgi:hypothetical protein
MTENNTDEIRNHDIVPPTPREGKEFEDWSVVSGF